MLDLPDMTICIYVNTGLGTPESDNLNHCSFDQWILK